MKLPICQLAIATALAVTLPATAQSCTGDIFANGVVNGADLGAMLSYWGPRTSDPFSVASDINSDGIINGGDLGALLSNWGPCTASVSSIVPSAGNVSGGATITITGAYLALTTGITVGGAMATNVTVANPTTLIAVTPPGVPGNADVVITGVHGTITVPGGFSYVSTVVPSWAILVEASPSPTMVTDATMRAAITATGLAWRVRDTATQMEMLLVPPGTFAMGCTASNRYSCIFNEIPTHSVTLTQAFYMGRYEVTQSQWMAKMALNPSFFQGANYPDAANRPVEIVSWDTIQGYLNATGMRLPSEAEWEFACRAGTTTAFNNGSSDDATIGTIAWYYFNSGGQTHVVGGKAPNALGLYDMAGNVAEWVNDWMGSTYYSVSPSTNPLGPVSGTFRVIRGGSYDNVTNELRSSSRHSAAPYQSWTQTGFRVARAP